MRAVALHRRQHPAGLLSLASSAVALSQPRPQSSASMPELFEDCRQACCAGNRERLDEMAKLASAFASWLGSAAGSPGQPKAQAAASAASSLRVNAFLTAAGLQDLNLFQLLR